MEAVMAAEATAASMGGTMGRRARWALVVRR